ncbi:hypothetical protein [Convivina praedatoris]|uniref:hypothetical protein n=1 Tax=Convivina praedatoris TaxID=2880963 RepID=UPI00200DA9E9|nr:hypothetical protein [Convivina sp. LMG 32447]CAH1855940.1 hypothetical protein R078138_01223 [Convivina sp. LMG 32447]
MVNKFLNKNKNKYCWYEPSKHLYLTMWKRDEDAKDLNKLGFVDGFTDYTDEEPWLLVALTEDELIQAKVEDKFNVKISNLVKLDPNTLREV